MRFFGVRPAVYVAAMAAVGTVYFLAAELGLSLAFIADQISPVWPPTGWALVVIFLGGTRMWPAVWLAAFAANALTSAPLPAALGIAGGNTLEALAGAWLLRQGGFRPELERVRDVLVLAAAGLCSPIVSASIGVTSLCVSGVQPWSAFPELWWTWWIGDAGGAWILAPLLFSGAALVSRVVALRWPRFSPALAAALPSLPVPELRLPRAVTAPRRLESALVLVGGTQLAAATFAVSPAGPHLFPQEYMLFPLMLWAGLRLPPSVVSALAALIVSVAVAATCHGLGPFYAGSTNRSLLALQVFVWMLMGSGLLLAACIAERRSLEDSLREHSAQQAEDHRRKDEFLAMLGHELRNPLMPISLGIELLRVKAGDSAAVEATRSVMERQLRHLVRLVDDLLDVSRITRAKLVLVKEPVDLHQLVEAAIERNHTLLEARGQRLAIDLGPGPVQLHADPVRLSQAISNLLHNASKYSPERSEIAISAAVEGTQVVLRVVDNGAGMTPELLGRVFEPFVQGERTLHQSQGGLGVGLTLARELVELHGGTIRATSPGPGKGTEIRIFLPVLVG